MSHGRQDTILKMLGGHFSDVVVSKVKEGKVFRGTGDNWDLKILKGSMRKDIMNEDLHLLSSNLIENRLTFSHLPNENPKGNIKDLPRSTFSLNVQEWKQYAENAKVWLLVELFFSSFPSSSFWKVSFLTIFHINIVNKWHKRQTLSACLLSMLMRQKKKMNTKKKKKNTKNLWEMDSWNLCTSWFVTRAATYR